MCPELRPCCSQGNSRSWRVWRFPKSRQGQAFMSLQYHRTLGALGEAAPSTTGSGCLWVASGEAAPSAWPRAAPSQELSVAGSVHLAPTATLSPTRLLHADLHTGGRPGKRDGIPACAQPAHGHQPRPRHHLDRSLHGQQGGAPGSKQGLLGWGGVGRAPPGEALWSDLHTRAVPHGQSLRPQTFPPPWSLPASLSSPTHSRRKGD